MAICSTRAVQCIPATSTTAAIAIAIAIANANANANATIAYLTRVLVQVLSGKDGCNSLTCRRPGAPS